MSKGKGSSKAGFGAGAMKMGGPGKKPMPPFGKKAPMAPDADMDGYKKGGVVKKKK